MLDPTADIQKQERRFLPKNFTITTWQELEPWFRNLENRDIRSKDDLEQWLKDSSEVEAVVSEDACWRQIRMTCDTENKSLTGAFNYFYTEIQPQIQPYADRLNKKLIGSPYTQELDQEKFFTYLRTVRTNISLFREENTQLFAELNVMQQQYGAIAGEMTIMVNDREYTLQQAGKFLESPDRELRESVYRKINERRLKDKDQLNDLFTQLIHKRHKVAQNAGFENYRDYVFVEKGRFDYTKEDCFAFHEGVKKYVVPLADRINRNKKNKLGLTTLRPWDTEAEPAGVQPLRPFKDGGELLQKSIDCFQKLRPFFADCLKKMNELRHLDLDSRKGKAPGGYNMPLAESGAPFIFMNAAGQMHDVTTMVHEGGHAIHSFLSHPLELTAFKEYPIEMAEVASMSMELFSIDYWNSFFDDAAELARAKEHQMERVITVMPWIATIDKFQHWLYENPFHTIEERASKWMEVQQEFSSSEIDFSGLDNYREAAWQRQLHLFEVPFYYIEYGIAQLGAIGMWKQYKENREKALDNYVKALSLGGTRTLPELYRAAGLPFDFSPSYIRQLMEFVASEMPG